jgi:hypothetical protein
MPAVDYHFGALHLSGTGGSLRVAIDETGFSTLSGTTLESWNTLKSDATFPKDILTSSGITFDTLSGFEKQKELIAIVMIAHLDHVTGSTDTLIRNMTLGFSMGDDEIGFRVRMWRERDSDMMDHSGSFTVWMNTTTLWISV